jgi:hypothetical protein
MSLARVDGVAQDLDHRALRPPLLVVAAGGNLALGEALLNGVGTHLFFDQPLIDLPHHRCLVLFDYQLLRRGLGLAQIALAGRGVLAPVHTALAGRKQPTATGALLNLHPFLFSKDALPL